MQQYIQHIYEPLPWTSHYSKHRENCSEQDKISKKVPDCLELMFQWHHQASCFEGMQEGYNLYSHNIHTAERPVIVMKIQLTKT